MNETYYLALSLLDPRRVNAVGMDGKNKFALIIVGNIPLAKRSINIPIGRLSLVEVFHFARANAFAVWRVDPY